ncbi:MAG TPA: GNAT family N-acetyltransferase [Gemmatimonadaceae bacterium]
MRVLAGDHPLEWLMAIILRTATPSDADDIASLLAVSWRAAYGSILTPDELAIVARDWHHPDRLRRQMSDPLVRFVSARTDAGALVGVATVKRSDDGVTVSVLRLYVVPGYQGQGIGSRLLGRALEAFPDAQRVELQVAAGNPSGLSFWTKQGFLICGHDEARIGDITLALTSMERTVSKLERS